MTLTTPHQTQMLSVHGRVREMFRKLTTENPSVKPSRIMQAIADDPNIPIYSITGIRRILVLYGDYASKH